MEQVPWYIERTNVGSNPFKACGDDWCNRCKMGVNTDQEMYSRGDEFVYRKRCLRCGGVIAHGMYRVKMLDGRLPSPDAALFIRERGRDRS